MSKFTEACMHFVPGPLRRRPKLAVVLACAGAVGAVGSGLAGFTDLLTYFDEQPLREDQAFITHQQFNTLIIPLVQNVEQMQRKIDRLNAKIDNLQQPESTNGGRAPASTPHMPTQPESTSEYPAAPSERNVPNNSSLQETLDRVQELQMQQRSLNQNPQ